MSQGIVDALNAYRDTRDGMVEAWFDAVFGSNGLTRSVGWLCDLLAIVAIAIGLGGSNEPDAVGKVQEYCDLVRELEEEITRAVADLEL